MLQDVLAHRPTEIDALNGGIVRAGARRRRADPAARDDRRADRRPRGRLGRLMHGSPRSATASCTSRRTRCSTGPLARRLPRRRRADGRQLRRLPRAHGRARRGRRHRHRRRRDPELPIGSFPERLAAAGVAPEDVDDVIFTHLHFDHVGWSTDGERCSSPTPSTTATRSTGTTGAADADAETGPGREDFGAIPAPERLAPLADSIALHDGRAHRDRPRRHAAARARPHAGALHRRARRRARALLADAAHNPAQLLSDDWTSVTDVDPELARATRAALADELRDSGTLIDDDPRRRQPLRPPRPRRRRRRWAYAPSIE